MKHKEFKDYLYDSISLLIVGILLLVCWLCFNNISYIVGTVRKLNRIIQPIVIGMVLAYLTSPIYNLIRDFLLKHIPKSLANEKEKQIIAKTTANIVSVLFVIAVVWGMLMMIIPQLIQSIMGIWEKLPEYMEQFYATMNEFIAAQPQDDQVIYDYINNIMLTLEQKGNDFISNFDVSQFYTLVSNVSSSITLIVKSIVNCFIGLIVMIYMLNIKDTLKFQGKKVVYSLAGKVWGGRIINELRYVNTVFGQFIVGKIFDSAIIGVLSYFILDAIHMPFPILIAAIIGMTNVIPFFGPFIGAVPASVLVLLTHPKQLIPFIIFVLVLQLFDGYILGPKILGNSTGLSGLWVLTSILVFGGMFGFVGMIIAVPAFAVIYDLIRRSVELRLRYLGIKDIEGKELYPVAEADDKVNSEENDDKEHKEEI